MAASSQRRTASSRDVFAALLHAGKRLHPSELDRYERESSEVRIQETSRAAWSLNVKGSKEMAKEPAWKEPTQKWLPSDDEEVEEVLAKAEGSKPKPEEEKPPREMRRNRRRKVFYRPEIVPLHFPALPPKHTWLQTPAFAKPTSSTKDPLEFLELKQASTMQTETSLRGLITSTEIARSLASSASAAAVALSRSSTMPQLPSHSSSTSDLTFQDVFGERRATTQAPNQILQVQSQAQKTVSPRSGTPVEGSAMEGVESTGSPEQIEKSQAQTATSTPTQEERRARLRMGRNLSLKLRNSSANLTADSSTAGPMTPVRAPMGRTRPNLMLKSARSRLSQQDANSHPQTSNVSSPLAASPTATPPPFALGLQARRNTLALANWSSVASPASAAARGSASGSSTPIPSAGAASSFTWGFPPPPPSAMTPLSQSGNNAGNATPWEDYGRGGGLMTPLTPGAGFVYPPTPLDVHSNMSFGQLQQQQQRRRYGSVIVNMSGPGSETGGIDLGGAGAGGAGANGEGVVASDFEIALPGIVNYQRSHPRLRT